MSFAKLFREVISAGLCTRCGACMGICPEEVISANEHSYPKLIGKCTSCELCNEVCPGADFDFPEIYMKSYSQNFPTEDCMGYYQKVFVCQTTVPEIRQNCSSGGVGTSLALALLKYGEVDGVGVVILANRLPYRAQAVLAKDEETIRLASQSKYAFVPVLKLLKEMRRQGGEYAIFTLPCQAMALKKIQGINPDLVKQVKYIIGLKCHYNMTQNAVIELMQHYGIVPEQISRLEYRGGEWPGTIQFTLRNGK